MTNGSLTEIQMISSTPLAANASLVRIKLGTWAVLHVAGKGAGQGEIHNFAPFCLVA